jgi:drug/metabolite transporter (DMT)-like permease
MLISTSSQELQLSEFLFLSWPELAVLISVAASAYSWIIMRKLVHHKNYSPVMVNGITMSIGGMGALLTAIYAEGPLTIADPPHFFGWLGLVILISNIICHNMYGYLLKKYTATFLSFAGFLSPLFTALYGWAFLQEEITPAFFISTVIVFIGLLLFYQDELLQQQSTLQHALEED